ncbi:HNH endonuclease [Gordonia sp. (in: high G+C Gram-positive bacteria)]|uniref:HNH endonuclease n=1 Tax=Gordonia sp. (in: high G+C Gram-positive bacteria) TaxID=84139 RepID=UPI003C76785F
MVSPKSLGSGATKCQNCRSSKFGESLDGLTGRDYRRAYQRHLRGENAPIIRKYGGSVRRRAAQYGVKFEPIDRVQVFQRDGWICSLCGDPVDPELAYPDPRSASIDHTIPISRGGDHVLANVTCSHLDCNIRKGAHSYEAQSHPVSRGMLQQ